MFGLLISLFLLFIPRIAFTVHTTYIPISHNPRCRIDTVVEYIQNPLPTDWICSGGFWERMPSIIACVNGVLFLVLIFTTVVWGEAEPDFMSVRKNVTKKYESEGHIPTEKYFREFICIVLWGS